jgi:hypothetical protein
MGLRWTVLCVLAAIVLASGLWAGEGPPPHGASHEPVPVPSAHDRVPMPTLGGNQFWADELFFHDWRIQRNAGSGQYRLLDGSNFRHASGSFARCVAALEEIKKERGLPPMRGKAVVLLHGLGDSRGMMSGLGRHLEEKGGYRVFNVSYPSTRQGVAEHAKGLASVIDHLDGIEEINFVGFSLGNIVLRRYFADDMKRNAGKVDPRFRRMVMIGPPNHGSELAANLGENKLFELLCGQAGQQLGQLWAWQSGSLATPPIPFGIVAGGCGDDRGFNPLLPGDDDGVVTVASTRLAGASDSILVPSLHAILPRESRVHQYILRFLQDGCFVAPDKRQPVKDDG